MPALRNVSGWTALTFVLGIVAVASLWQCAGSSRQASETDRSLQVIESDRAYLRLPGDMTGAEIQIEQVGPQLIRCYELQASGGAWDVTHVNLELVWSGGRFRAQVGQGRANLSESFASCIDQAAISWSFDPGVSSEGEIIPLEFGPNAVPESP